MTSSSAMTVNFTFRGRSRSSSRVTHGGAMRRTLALHAFSSPGATNSEKSTIAAAAMIPKRVPVQTIGSVLRQTALSTGRAALQYLICDGASTDGTLDVVRRLATGDVAVDSMADSGMYDALARGLRQVRGDWVAYLNAGDLLAERAFDTILDVAEEHDVQWVTGMATRYSERGAVTAVSLPFRYRRSLMATA